MARPIGIATLKYLEENILLAPRTVEEVPGYEIPYLYFDYLRDGDTHPLKGVSITTPWTWSRWRLC